MERTLRAITPNEHAGRLRRAPVLPILWWLGGIFMVSDLISSDGRYNGGELPTTVIVDAQGNVRRRFVGARTIAVFEAMIAEASLPYRTSVAASAGQVLEGSHY